MPAHASAIPNSIPRAALVTGGGKRLGRAIALALAEAGFDVAVHFNASRGEAEATCDAIRHRGRRAMLLQADLAREAETLSLIPAATAASTLR